MANFSSNSSSNSSSSSLPSPSSSPTSSPPFSYYSSSSFPPPIYGGVAVPDSNGAQYNGKIIAASLAMLCLVLLFIAALHVYAKWSWAGPAAGARRRTHDHRSASSLSSASSSSRYSSAGSLLYAHEAGGGSGLDRLAIDSLLSFVYNSGCTTTTAYLSIASALASAARRECAVCLSEFQDGDGCRALPKCRHSFHAACIDKWLASHTTCPLCRADVAAAVAIAAPNRGDANVARPGGDSARDRMMATGADFVGPRTPAQSSPAGHGRLLSVQVVDDSDPIVQRPSAALPLAAPGWRSSWTAPRSISHRFLHPAAVQFPTNVLFWGDSSPAAAAAPDPLRPPLQHLLHPHPPPHHRRSPSDPESPLPNSSRGPVFARDSCTAAAHLHHHRSSSFGGTSTSSSSSSSASASASASASSSSGPIGGSQLNAFKRLLCRDKKIRVFPTQQQHQQQLQEEGQEQDKEAGHGEEGTSDASSS